VSGIVPGQQRGGEIHRTHSVTSFSNALLSMPCF